MVLASVTLALFTPSEAFAYRPFDGTDAAVVEPGEFELEAGPTWRVVDGHSEEVIAPGLDVNGSLAPGVEIGAETEDGSAVGPDGARPITPVEGTLIAVKTVLLPGCLQNGEGPSIAAEIAMPAPDRNGYFTPARSIALIVSDPVGPFLLHANASMERDPEGANEVESILMWETAESLGLRPVGEVGATVPMGAPPEIFGLIGAIWERDESLSFDIAAKAAMQEASLSGEARIGLTWTWAAGS